MTRFSRLCRAVGVGLAVGAATLSMTQVAHAESAPPTVPANLVPKAGNQVFLVGHVSKGVQIYKCDGKAWTFVAPEADLVGDNGQLIIKHSAGPTWTATTDGSSVVAKKVAEANVADKDGKSAIPWLLLEATKTTTGSGDKLTHTTFIQRVNTVGGLAPTDRCNGSTAGTEKRVPYGADYFFWKATGA